MILYEPGSFFSTSHRGEEWKLGKGGESKGPATRPSDISLSIMSETILGLQSTDLWFFTVKGGRGP